MNKVDAIKFPILNPLSYLGSSLLPDTEHYAERTKLCLVQCFLISLQLATIYISSGGFPNVIHEKNIHGVSCLPKPTKHLAESSGVLVAPLIFMGPNLQAKTNGKIAYCLCT